MTTTKEIKKEGGAGKKESMVFYADWFEIVEQLPREKRYDAFKAIGAYAMEGRETSDPQLAVFMAFVKRQIDRDSQRYASISERNRANGLKGGRPRKNPQPEPAKDEEEECADCQKIIDRFNETMDACGAKIPRVSRLTDRRRKAIKALRGEGMGTAEIAQVIGNAARSDFLNGGGDRGFVADFDWILNPANFVKILEGTYNHNKIENYDDTKKLKSYHQRQTDMRKAEFRRHIMRQLAQSGNEEESDAARFAGADKEVRRGPGGDSHGILPFAADCTDA